MRTLSSIILALTLLLASYTVAYATQYYLNNTCANNGDGTALTCASGVGLAGPFTCSGGTISTSGWAVGSDLSIYDGTTTYGCAITAAISGNSSSDYAEINSYNQGFMGLADPIIDGSALQTDAWTLASGSVYSATNTEANIPKMVTANGTRLKYRVWNTDIATTITGTTSTGRNNSTDAMEAGSYTFDNPGDKIYVWMTDSSSPAGDTIRYSKTSHLVATTGARSYIKIDGIDFKMSNGGTQGSSASSGVYLGYGTGTQCDNCVIANVDSSLSGLRGLTIAGENQSITDSTCTSSAWEAANPDMGCIVADGQATGETINNGVWDNLTVTNTIHGSCFEVNGNGSGFSATDLTCTGGHIGIEVYGCSSGSCSGLAIQNSTFDRINIDNTGYTAFDAFSRGMSLNSGSHANVAKNIKIKNVEYAPIALTGADADGMAYQNEVYNVTVYNDSFNTSSGSSAAINFGNAAVSTIGLNKLKNIVIKMDGVSGRCISSIAGATKDIMDKVICATPGDYAKYNNTTYATLALFQTAYTAATGLTYNSSSSDPLINSTTLRIGDGSPAIAFGEVLASVTTDFTGALRGTTNDAGAYQHTVVAPAGSTTLGSGTFGGMRIE